eukprot:TRINITY_DN5104_c0_g1_i1.p1 TRINITY_DN5104_c0_g1~~TRINITY_DN5104_c0_g1_i1.p1  ORF type:complete len:1330 (+),score=282.97 TRINITY_DN5104_c0_g1_i1:111-4100(+)
MMQLQLLVLVGVSILLTVKASPCGTDGLTCLANQTCCCDGNGDNCTCCDGGCENNQCCGFPAWSDYTPITSCSQTCGGGVRTLQRTCEASSTSHPACNNARPGSTCTLAAIGLNETTTGTCNQQCCPTDADWSAWSEWGECPSICSGGSRNRTRTCIASDCPSGVVACGTLGDVDVDTQSCAPSPPIDGTFGPWSDWSACNASCGNGTRTRTRTCRSARCGGSQVCNPLQGLEIEAGPCATTLPPCPADGRWSAWEQTGTCSVTCGSGVADYRRECLPPVGGAQQVACNGFLPGSVQTSVRACNTNTCCPVPSTWSQWNTTSSCSTTCGIGVETRTRVCQPAVCGGNNAGCTGQPVGSVDTRSFACDTGRCCPVNADYDFSGWTLWSKPCGARVRTRVVRTCPALCGGECPLNPKLMEESNTTCTPIRIPADTVTATLVFPIPSYGIADIATTSLISTLQRQLELELNSPGFVSNTAAAEVYGNASEVVLTAMLTLQADRLSELTTTNMRCEAICGVDSSLTSSNTMRRLRQADGFENVTEVIVRDTSLPCDCATFVSRRSAALNPAQPSDEDDDMQLILILSCLAGALVLLAFVVWAYRRRHRAIADKNALKAHPSYHGSVHSSKGKRSKRASINPAEVTYEDPNDTLANMAPGNPMGLMRHNTGDLTISNPLFRSNSMLQAKSMRASKSGPTSATSGSSTGSTPAELAYKQGRRSSRRSNHRTTVQSAQQEPPLALLQHRQGMLVLYRTGPGCYTPVHICHRTKHSDKEAAIACKTEGGYVFLRNSPTGQYHAVKTSSSDDQDNIMVVHTLMDTAVLLVKKHDKGFTNVTDYSRIEPAAVARSMDPKLGDVLMVVLHPETQQETDDEGEAHFVVPNCSVLQRQADSTTVFEPVKVLPSRPPSQVGVPLRSGGGVMTLQRLQDGSYVKMAGRPQGDVEVAQALSLPPTHYKEVLSKQLAQNGHQRLVTLLQSGSSATEFRIMERSDGGLYQQGRLASDVPDMDIERQDGGYIRLHRSSGGYTRVLPDEDASSTASSIYTEIVSTTKRSGQMVSLIQGDRGEYAVLKRDMDGIYTRPDTGAEYMSREELQQQMASVPASTRSSSRRQDGSGMRRSPSNRSRPSASAIRPVVSTSGFLNALVEEPEQSRPSSNQSQRSAPIFRPMAVPRRDSARPSSPDHYASLSQISPRQRNMSERPPPLPTVMDRLSDQGSEALSAHETVPVHGYNRNSQAPGPARITAEHAQQILIDEGLLAGSYVLQRLNPSSVWLHMVFAREIHVIPLYLDGAFGQVEELDNGNFVGPDLEAILARFLTDYRGLPCPLGINLTPL